eukprot:COSAG01_NODE_14329_length_1467_cov_6.167398_3_plen_40_part_01
MFMGVYILHVLLSQQWGNLCLFTATVPCRLAALARCRGQL